MSIGSVDSEARKAWAVPANCSRRVGGAPMRCCIWLMSTVAWPREVPRARLNEMVTEGKNDEWFTASDDVAACALVKACNGTDPLPEEWTKVELRLAGSR